MRYLCAATAGCLLLFVLVLYVLERVVMGVEVASLGANRNTKTISFNIKH